MTPQRGGIGLWHGVALYLSALLGAGVLVLPGQVASMAGPASLLAWAASALLGLPLAFTFAALATRHPGAGGIMTYAERAFGPTAGGIGGWWYFVAVSVGHTVVPLTAGYYLAAAFGLPQAWSPLLAAGVLLLALASTLAGLRASGRAQMALAGGVAAILLSVILVAAPDLDAGNFAPFAPAGIAGVGQAVVVLFMAFAGWEAIAHLSGEFRDVRRTLPRATVLTVVIVTVLYLGLALVVVGTGTYGTAELDRVAMGVIVAGGVGAPAAAVMAVAALVICLGTTNAFMASAARLGLALAWEGWAPAALARRAPGGVPWVAALAVAGIGGLGLAASAVLGWGTQTLVFVPAVLVLATYLLGAAAATRLFAGRLRALGALTFVLLLLTVPFAGWHLLVPVGIALAVTCVRTRRLPRRA